MINHVQALTPFGRPIAVATPTPFRRIRSATQVFFRELWVIIHTVANMRHELKRMADEVERTRPEHAARLRRLATSHWGE